MVTTRGAKRKERRDGPSKKARTTVEPNPQPPISPPVSPSPNAQRRLAIEAPSPPARMGSGVPETVREAPSPPARTGPVAPSSGVPETVREAPSPPARTKPVAPSSGIPRTVREASSPPARTEPVTPSSGIPQTEIDDLEPIHPENFFFHNSNYTVSCRLSSACDNVKTIDYLKEYLSDEDYNWFTTHPQFKHIFHMPREKNHMLTHMWMLLVRTVKKEKGKMAWFIVNGVPVRYSLREHCLLSSLSCKTYPEDYENMFGGYRYARNYWGIREEDGKKKKKIVVRDLLRALTNMPEGTPKLQTALLLFLSTVIKRSKTYGYIHPFLIKAVDDLEGCLAFPWGRLSFDNQLDIIWHTMEKFRGDVQEAWTFPGFILPLEILACEAIPIMHSEFRMSYHREGVSDTCSRMCKTQWKPCLMKGWPLETVNDVLGETKEINSILRISTQDTLILHNFMEKEDVYEGEDDLSVNWNKFILEAGKEIFFEDLFELDVGGRRDNLNARRNMSLKETLMKALDDFMSTVNEKLEKVIERLDEHGGRLETTEMAVAKLQEWRRDRF